MAGKVVKTGAESEQQTGRGPTPPLHGAFASVVALRCGWSSASTLTYPPAPLPPTEALRPVRARGHATGCCVAASRR
jgi:hypothetical protein